MSLATAVSATCTAASCAGRAAAPELCFLRLVLCHCDASISCAWGTPWSLVPCHRAGLGVRDCGWSITTSKLTLHDSSL